MRGVKLSLFALMFFFVAPVMAATYSDNTCSPHSAGSWMDDLTIVQLFNAPNDYKWQGTWDPRYDADWQRDYCGPLRILAPSSQLDFNLPHYPQ
jgi:hypothetical protein